MLLNFISIAILFLLFSVVCTHFCASQVSESEAGMCVSSDGLRNYKCVSRQCLSCASPVDNSNTQVDQRSGCMCVCVCVCAVRIICQCT